jgi:hypothetical protein
MPCLHHGEILLQHLKIDLHLVSEHSVLLVNIEYCLTEQGCPFGCEDGCLSLPKLLDEALAKGHGCRCVEWHVAPEL